MSLPQVMELYGTEEKCEAPLHQARWPEVFIFPRCGEKEHGLVYGRRLKRYPCRRSHNAATDHLVPCFLLNRTGQDWHFLAGPDQATWCERPDSLADPEQDHAGHV